MRGDEGDEVEGDVLVAAIRRVARAVADGARAEEVRALLEPQVKRARAEVKELTRTVRALEDTVRGQRAQLEVRGQTKADIEREAARAKRAEARVSELEREVRELRAMRVHTVEEGVVVSGTIVGKGETR